MQYVIDRQTGTYSDTLHAIGLASLMEELSNAPVTVLAKNGSYVIVADRDPSFEVPSPGFLYIWERSKEPVPPLGDVLDYEREKEKLAATRKAGKRAKSEIESQETESLPEAHPETSPAMILASLRGTWTSDRMLYRWVQEHRTTVAGWAAFELGLASTRPKKLPRISNTQVLNPISGKGGHAAKTTIGKAGPIPNRLVIPFAEWMKMRGLWRAMVLFRDGKNFKVFVIEPANAPLSALVGLRAALQRLSLGNGVRLDIQSTLRTLELLITQSDAVQSGPSIFNLLGHSPVSVIAGLRQSYFKNLGKSAALMNDAFLPIPAWFPVTDRTDAEDYLRILQEVTARGGCLDSLKDTHSDDVPVLQQYREWLLTGELADLLDFHFRFAVHLVQRLSRKKWARPFNAQILTVLLNKSYGEQNVKEIIADPGFQSVARALRDSTIRPLRQPDFKREVRYGIAQQWKQKMRSGADEFTTVVAQFVQDFNWETARRLEGRGHSVTTEDLNSLLALIHSRSAELVGSLLLAYGYAWAPKVDQSPAAGAEPAD